MYARNQAILRQRVYEKSLYCKWTVWKSLLLRVMHYNSWEGQDANTGLNCSSLNPEVSPVRGGSRSLSCVRSGQKPPKTSHSLHRLFSCSPSHISQSALRLQGCEFVSSDGEEWRWKPKRIWHRTSAAPNRCDRWEKTCFQYHPNCHRRTRATCLLWMVRVRWVKGGEAQNRYSRSGFALQLATILLHDLRLRAGFPSENGTIA